MGGKAFANRKPPLPTPRMPPSVYLDVRDSVMRSLSILFAHVASPIPLPHKTSHGDIDIMVCEPLPPYTLLAKSLSSGSPSHTLAENKEPAVAITPAFLEEYLHAAAHINNPQSKTFAIPYPDLHDTYIQVDITILPSLEALNWNRTLHSYGALFTVIGSIMCKPNGLTLNDKGLYLRIPEIETHDKKRSSVLLSADWDTVMDTLGLDVTAFKRGFNDVSDIWAWIAAATFFDRADVGYKERNSKKRKGGNGEMWEAFETWLVERERYLGIVTESGDVNEDDEDERRALKERKRQEVFEVMVARFGVRREIEKRVSEWRMERQELEEKKVRKEARRFAYEEDDRYGNAWLGWLDDEKEASGS